MIRIRNYSICTVSVFTFITRVFTFYICRGKAAKPRCFKNRDIRSLNVVLRNNSKAFRIQHENEKKKKNILILMDNAACHPSDLQLSSIKIGFSQQTRYLYASV